jgi:hypothetical protein
MLSAAANAFAVQVCIDPLDNRVCNHFRDTRESNRILYPIWDTVTDNLVFIPVPLEFVFFVQGLPVALVKENKARIHKNDNVYGMFVKGVVDGNPGMVATHSFVSICEAKSYFVCCTFFNKVHVNLKSPRKKHCLLSCFIGSKSCCWIFVATTNEENILRETRFSDLHSLKSLHFFVQSRNPHYVPRHACILGVSI